MMMVLSLVMFTGVLATATGVIVASILPQWQRIARLAMGHVEQPFAPLTTLARAERRIAVRRWASVHYPAQVSRRLAAA